MPSLFDDDDDDDEYIPESLASFVAAVNQTLEETQKDFFQDVNAEVIPERLNERDNGPQYDTDDEGFPASLEDGIDMKLQEERLKGLEERRNELRRLKAELVVLDSSVKMSDTEPQLQQQQQQLSPEIEQSVPGVGDDSSSPDFIYMSASETLQGDIGTEPHAGKEQALNKNDRTNIRKDMFPDVTVPDPNLLDEYFVKGYYNPADDEEGGPTFFADNSDMKLREERMKGLEDRRNQLRQLKAELGLVASPDVPGTWLQQQQHKSPETGVSVSITRDIPSSPSMILMAESEAVQAASKGSPIHVGVSTTPCNEQTLDQRVNIQEKAETDIHNTFSFADNAVPDPNLFQEQISQGSCDLVAWLDETDADPLGKKVEDEGPSSVPAISSEVLSISHSVPRIGVEPSQCNRRQEIDASDSPVHLMFPAVQHAVELSTSNDSAVKVSILEEDTLQPKIVAVSPNNSMPVASGGHSGEPNKHTPIGNKTATTATKSSLNNAKMQSNRSSINPDRPQASPITKIKSPPAASQKSRSSKKMPGTQQTEPSPSQSSGPLHLPEKDLLRSAMTSPRNLAVPEDGLPLVQSASCIDCSQLERPKTPSPIRASLSAETPSPLSMSSSLPPTPTPSDGRLSRASEAAPRKQNAIEIPILKEDTLKDKIAAAKQNKTPLAAKGTHSGNKPKKQTLIENTKVTSTAKVSLSKANLQSKNGSRAPDLSLARSIPAIKSRFASAHKTSSTNRKFGTHPTMPPSSLSSGPLHLPDRDKLRSVMTSPNQLSVPVYEQRGKNGKSTIATPLVQSTSSINRSQLIKPQTTSPLRSSCSAGNPSSLSTTSPLPATQSYRSKRSDGVSDSSLFKKSILANRDRTKARFTAETAERLSKPKSFALAPNSVTAPFPGTAFSATRLSKARSPATPIGFCSVPRITKTPSIPRKTTPVRFTAASADRLSKPLRRFEPKVDEHAILPLKKSHARFTKETAERLYKSRTTPVVNADSKDGLMKCNIRFTAKTAARLSRARYVRNHTDSCNSTISSNRSVPQTKNIFITNSFILNVGDSTSPPAR